MESDVVNLAREVVVSKMKADLRLWLDRVSNDVWNNFFPDGLMPLCSHTESHHLNHHLIGHELVETYLERDGTIIEKLVHYESDDYDAKIDREQLLGETSDERYQALYYKALSTLHLMHTEGPSIRL